MYVERIEFRLINLIVLPDLGIEPLQRLEVLPLMRVVKSLAKIEVVQFFRLRRSRPEQEQHASRRYR